MNTRTDDGVRTRTSDTTNAGDDTTRTNNGGGDDNAAELEARARRLGWRPENEYRGPKAQWMPADAYVEKVETDVPVMRERLRFQDRQLASTQRQLGDIQSKLDQTTKVLGDFAEYQKTVATQQYERGRADLKAELEDAASRADVAGVRAAQTAIEQLDQSHAKTTAATTVTKPAAADDDRTKLPQVSPATEAWMNTHRKIMTHPKANPVAVNLHGANLASGMTEDESYEVLEEQIAERLAEQLPELFEPRQRQQRRAAADDDDAGDDTNRNENPRRNAPGAVRQPGNARRKTNGKTYDDLPAGDKAACDALCGQMIIDAKTKKPVPLLTREQYVKDYKW